jgi:tRNA (cytidine/uridine-2'-O-)-methyltransferase
MRVVLFQPDIPQNTGTILRLCACLAVEAHIIEPAGFPVSDRHFRRSGMDYLDQVTIVRRLLDCLRDLACRNRRTAGSFFDKGGNAVSRSYLQGRRPAAVRRESAGVPDDVVNAADQRLLIPIAAGMRSLNVAMTVAMALGEALRQTRGTAR